MFLAIGGLAISGIYAIGGLAVAPRAIGALGADPEFVRTLKELWPGIGHAFPDAGR